MYNVKGHIKANGFTNHKSANNSIDKRKNSYNIVNERCFILIRNICFIDKSNY